MPNLNEFGAVGVVVGLVAMIVVGIIQIGLGQVYLALREITLNGRRSLEAAAGPGTGASDSSYRGLEFVGGLLELLGWIIILAAIVIGVTVLGHANGR